MVRESSPVNLEEIIVEDKNPKEKIGLNPFEDIYYYKGFEVRQED